MQKINGEISVSRTFLAIGLLDPNHAIQFQRTKILEDLFPEEKHIPLMALEAFYKEISLLSVIEFESYDDMGQLNEQLQITATHPDLGILTIRQTASGAEMLADHHFDFEERDFRSGNLLEQTEWIERRAADAVKFIRFKANRASIPIQKIKLDRLDHLIN